MSHATQVDQPSGRIHDASASRAHAAQPTTRINQIVALVAYAPEQVPAKREDSQQ